MKTVTRYVITRATSDPQYPPRTIFGPAQGRNTYATEDEAKARLAAVLANNSADKLAEHMPLEVRPCQCWPVHFDPVGVWFD